MTSFDTLNLADIKKRSVIGVFALTSRTAILQVISFAATFLLTIFLSPEVFGIFFVVTAIVSFLNYFSDIGLAAALIQKKEEVQREDLQTTFTIQQIIVIVISVLALTFSDKIADFYSLSVEGLWLFRVLVISFFLSSLKTIPSVILERKLDFNRLIIPQIVEVLFFYLTAVILAWLDFGIRSFTYAVLFRGVSGVIVIYILQPWEIGVRLNGKSAKKLLSFGVPFQINSILALVKDDLFTLFLGKILPFSQIGYIGWAKKWAEVPLRLIMDSIIKVTFPAYSRLQKYPEKLSIAVNKSIFFLSFFILPISFALILFIKPLLFLIPKYSKWEPALFSFYLFVASSALAGISTPLINALNAIGKIKISLFFMIAWTILTWILMPILIFTIGFSGVAVASVIISSTTFAVIYVSKKYIQYSLLKNMIPSLVGSTIMFIYAFLTQGIVENNIALLTVNSFISASLYIFVLFVFFKNQFLDEVKKIFLIVRS